MSANPPDVGQKIRSLGREITREMVQGTMQAYAPLHAAAPTDGVTVTKDVRYGEHERNVLDLYVPQKQTGAKPPIMVFAHGGGFVRGDKSEVANIGYYFARHGVVTIAMSYRLAPESKWPSGPQDVAQVVKWVKDNAAVHGGDTSRLFLAGNSAGAMHIAAYVFYKQYHVENDGVAGVILISSPAVNLSDHVLDPMRDAIYYGTDASNYADRSVINHLDESKLPVLLAVGELDLPLVDDQNRQLIDALYKRDNALPVFKTVLGHNHISIVEHIGTADESLGPDVIEFITRPQR
jgi:acetyl esterase/lipase